MRPARLVLAAACLGAAGCSLAPDYEAPPAPVPAAYDAPAPWTAADPADRLPRGTWWAIYEDERLSALEQKLEANNPDLAAALAHYDQARAYDAATQSGLFPTVSGGAQADRDRQSDTRPLRGANQPDEYGAYTVGLEAVYDLDLWGKIRSEVSAAQAETQAAADDLATARLSLETRLANDYVALLGEDRQIKLLTDTVESYGKALDLTHTLHDGGLVSGLDVSRAQAQLDGARAQVSESRSRRALLEHAIAALVGEPAPGFSIPADAHLVNLPQIPAGLPSTLLQRRPDIAAAERRTAAANAGIGVARAAFFPDINLSADFGVQSTSPATWLTAPSAFWALGPSLAQTIFDAGLHRARLDQAKAALQEASARYRGVVLEAFRQVQDNLSLLADYNTEYGDQSSAVAAADHTLDLSLEQYRDGAADYLGVVESQVAALAARRALLSLETRRLQASIDLVRAVGGGWSAEAPPQLPVAAAAAR
jgi:NodT family efflux transporter outer membrane factor (OMF) lipoprotein